MNEKKKEEKNLGSEVSRRDFIKGAATGALAVAATGVLSACATPGAAGAAARRQSRIFEPTNLGSLQLKNMMFRAAMLERRHDANGTPTSALIRMAEEEAAGGVSLVIVGSTRVLREDIYGSGGSFIARGGFYDASQIPVYRQIVDIIHRNGAKACLQLSLRSVFDGVPTAESLRRDVNAFAQSAILVRDAGFDAISLHFAHRYGIASILSHHANTRTDEFGGPVENRARFAFEIVEAVSRAVGRNFPLTAKIDADDHNMGVGARDVHGVAIPSGSLADTQFIVQGLADRGVDAVEISGAQMIPLGRDIIPREDHNFFAKDARAVAQGTNVPLMLTGGVRSVARMEESLGYNPRIMGFGMARTLLAEPDLPNKWQQQNINQEPKCIACSWCLDNLFTAPRMLCVLDQNRV